MNDHEQPARAPIVTLLLIALNVLLYLVQVGKGVDWLNPSPASLLDWGGNLASVTLLGQPWRLLTSMFLHVGLLHLVTNMYMLLTFGSLVERRFGHVRFLLVYLLAGLCGSLVSALWHADPYHQVVAAGASGALMGLCGAYLADWLVAEWKQYEHDGSAIRGPLIQTIIINLAIGATVPSIDNACHVGGLIGGFVVGGAFALVYYRYDGIKNAAAVALISCLALGGMHARLHSAPSPGLAELIEQKEADQAKRNEADSVKRAQAERARQIADDRRRGPRTVSKEMAAGTTIALPAPSSSLFVMPDARHIAVTGEADHALRFIDLATGTAAPAIKGQGADTGTAECFHGRCTPDHANAVAVTADGRVAYVTSMVTDGVGIVDVQTQKMVGSFKTGKQPRAIALNKAASRAYVLNNGADTVVAIDLATRKIVGKPVTVGNSRRYGSHPTGLWLAADDKELWVLDESASRLVVLDAATLAEANEVIVTSGFMNGVHVDLQRGKAWLVGVDAMDLIDLTSKKIEKTAYFCHGVMGAAIAINHDGSALAMADLPGFVRIVNLRTMVTMAAYPFEGTAAGLRFSPDDKQLYFIANGPARMSVFDTQVTNALNQVVTEAEPEGFCSILSERN